MRSPILLFDRCPSALLLQMSAGFIRDTAAMLATATDQTLLQLGLHIVFTRCLFNDAFQR